MSLEQQDREPFARGAEQATRVLELFLQFVLWIGIGIVIAGALLIMMTMDAGSRSQGGRIYVAIGAMVALGAIDNRFRWLARRRYGPWLIEPWGYYRYRTQSLLLLALAAAVLFGFALLLP
jgi:hypothetical protein